MIVKDITQLLESFAPLSLQEDYDNSGLLTGFPEMEISGVLLCIDVTESVINEAIQLDVNMIIAHHPFIFKGLKRVTGENEDQRCLIKAIRHDIAIYAAHTNMDNLLEGVNGRIADKLGLINRTVLSPLPSSLSKLSVFVPKLHAQRVREAMFNSGAGKIGNYDSCSFNMQGLGSFRPNEHAHPFTGIHNKLHYEDEVKIEIVLPSYLQKNVVNAMLMSHPYEVPAYDIYKLENLHPGLGAGLIGELPEAKDESIVLRQIKEVFQTPVIRHTALLNKPIKKVALCGGAGSFLLSEAKSAGADIFISGDFKYHDFFVAEGKILIADPGHYESEQFTKEIFFEIIQKKFPTFALHISKVHTNPILYL